MKRYIYFICLISIIACKRENIKTTVDTVEVEEKTLAKSFTFSPIEKFVWEDIEYNYPTSEHIDFDKLESTEFKVNGFRPANEMLKSQAIDWSKAEEQSINLDTFPTLPFNTQMHILPEPKITLIKAAPNNNQLTPTLMTLEQQEGLDIDGLSVPIEDKDGILWFSYNKGICKYVGNHLYAYEFGGKNIEISDLELDAFGRIWISTYGKGVYIFDIKNGVIHRYTDQLSIIRIFKDHDGNMWMTSFARMVYKVTLGYGQVKVIDKLTGKDRMNLIYQVFEDSDKNLWLGGRRHISIINPERNKMVSLDKDDGIEVNIAHDFMEDKEGKVWFNSFLGNPYMVSLEDSLITAFNSESNITSHVEDDQGKIWAIGIDTIFVINANRNKINTVVTKVSPSGYLTKKALVTKNGLLYLSNDKKIVNIDTKGLLQDFKPLTSSLSGNLITSFAQDRIGQIWMGTNQGLKIYDAKNETLKSFKEGQGVNSSMILELSVLQDGRIFVVTGEGFSIIDVEKGKADIYKNQRTNYRRIYSGTLDTDNRLWITTDRGIFIMDEKRKTNKRLPAKIVLSADNCTAIIDDQNDNYWISSLRGLAVINKSFNTIKYLRKSNGLINDRVGNLALDKNKNIWAATSEGLSIINPVAQTIVNLDTNDGLVSNEINSMICNRGRTFVGTGEGMMVISELDGAYRVSNFYKNEGFEDFNFSYGSLSTDNGQVMMGTSEGLLVLNQYYEEALTDPVAEITSVDILEKTPYFSAAGLLRKYVKPIDTIWNIDKSLQYEKSNLPKDSSYAAENGIRYDYLTNVHHLPIGLELPSDQNSLNFSFTNSEYRGRSNSIYKYTLHGPGLTINKTTNQPESEMFYNLRSGQYIFDVSTLGFNNVWSAPSTFSFVVKPPWWKSPLAVLLYFVIIPIFLKLLIDLRARSLKKENKILNEKLSIRNELYNSHVVDLKTTQEELLTSQSKVNLGELYTCFFALATVENNTIEYQKLMEGISSEKTFSVPLNTMVKLILTLAQSAIDYKSEEFPIEINEFYDPSIEDTNTIGQDLGLALFMLIKKSIYSIQYRSNNWMESMPYSPVLSITITYADIPVGILHTTQETVSGKNYSNKWYKITIKDNGDDTQYKSGSHLDIIKNIIAKNHIGEFHSSQNQKEGNEATILLPIYENEKPNSIELNPA